MPSQECVNGLPVGLTFGIGYAARQRRPAGGEEYSARIISRGRWTAEWRIPFASLGIDPTGRRRFEFNVTVRETAEPVWLMWQGTGGHSWRVDRASVIELE